MVCRGSARAALAACFALAALAGVAAAQPANDLCPNATVISAVPFSDTVSVTNATDDADVSCNSGSTAARFGVWYTYTVGPEPVAATIAETSSVDTFRTVFTGGCGGLTEVGCVDAETLTLVLQANTQYWILTGPWSSSTTAPTTSLVVTFNAVPATGACCTAVGGSCSVVTPAACASSGGVYRGSQSTCGANICNATPANDLCVNATVVSAFPHSETVDLGGATDDVDVSCNSTAAPAVSRFGVWQTYTAGPTGDIATFAETSTVDTVRAVFTGGCNGLTQIACSDGESLTLVLAANTQYWFLTAPFSTSATPPTTSLVITLNATPVPPPPANDLCSDATVITAVPFTDSVSGTGATDDVDVSCNSTTDPAVSRFGVWHTYTTGSADEFAVLGETSTLDTVRAVFTGGCGGLTQTACADAETLNLTLNANTQYWFLTTTFSTGATPPTTSYAITFTSAPVPPTPPNDLCENATVVAAVPFTETVGGYNATDDTDVTCNSTTDPDVSRFGVWHTLTVGSEPVVATIGETSSLDTVRAVFTGGCNGLTQIACSDGETLTTVLPANAQYWVLTTTFSTSSTQPTTSYVITINTGPVTGACCSGVGGTCSLATAPACASSSGIYRGDLTTCAANTCSAPPANDLCVNATVVTTLPFSETINIGGAGDDFDVSCNSTTAPSVTRFGVWHRYTPTEAVTATIGETSSVDTVRAVFTGGCNGLTEIACADSETLAVVMTANTQYWILTAPWSTTGTPPTTSLVVTLNAVAAPGACCNGTSCSIATQSACGSGVYKGPNSTCAPTPRHLDSTASALPDGTDASATPGIVTKTFNLTQAGTVSDVNVLIDMAHTFVGDLRLTLTSPSGTVVSLMQRPNGTTAAPTCPTNFTATGDDSELDGRYVFDDSAATSLNAAALTTGADVDIASGSYRAAECGGALVDINAALAGQSITGTWTVTIGDYDQVDTGTVRVVGLEINNDAVPACAPTCRADFDASGAVNVSDIFAFLSAWFAQTAGSDFDNSGAVNVSDIFAFLSAWFAGCP